MARTAGRGIIRLPGDRPVAAVAFHPAHSAYLAVGSRGDERDATRGGFVREWDLRTEKTTLQFTDHNDPIHALSFAPDGGSLAMAVQGANGVGRVSLWRLGNLAWIGKLPFPNDPSWRSMPQLGNLTRISFFPDGNSLMVAGTEGRLAVLSTETGAERFRLGKQRPSARQRPASKVCHVPENNLLACATQGEQEIRLCSADNGRHMGTIRGLAPVEDMIYRARCLAVACSDRTIRIHRDEFGQFSELIDLRATQIGPLARAVRHLALSHDGTRLAASCADGTIRVWMLEGGSPVEVLALSADCTAGLCFSPDGRSLAAAVGNDVVVWGAVPQAR
jgi:WD40 repeat protein